jgi:hypothetical protein
MIRNYPNRGPLNFGYPKQAERLPVSGPERPATIHPNPCNPPAGNNNIFSEALVENV